MLIEFAIETQSEWKKSDDPKNNFVENREALGIDPEKISKTKIFYQVEE